MSYLVLARKWRPQRFDDIVGQGHITRILTNAIRSERIAHAYLFTGVRGVGKTTAARVLAKALNCESGPTVDPCGRCHHCEEIASGSGIDVYEIDGASNTSIDNVREIIENARYHPAKGRFKIYIIDEVHQISKAAFNALLKTLEEPPSYVKFILATTEVHKIPETILSRCQRLDFRRISVRDIIQRLREIAQSERLPIHDGALFLLAREAEGSMRDAQSLLEQVLAYSGVAQAGDQPAAEIDERLLQDALGMARREILYELSSAVLQRDPKKCLELVGQAADQSVDMVRLSRDLVEHFRNLLVVSLARGGEGKGEPDRPLLTRILDLVDQEIEELGRQGAGLSSDGLADCFEFMARGDEETARSAYPRFSLETALVRLATLPSSVPVIEVIERLERLERRLSKAEPEKQAAAPRETPSASQPAPTPSAVAPRIDAPPAEVWKEFVALVRKEKMFLALHLESTRVLALPPGALKIGVEERHHLSYLQDPENLALLRAFARSFFSSDVQVIVVPVAAEDPAPALVEANAAKAAGGEDLVRETLRIFGGSVKEVKRENG
jgi:DNA polymerase-3 subunit gamma/tau